MVKLRKRFATPAAEAPQRMEEPRLRLVGELRVLLAGVTRRLGGVRRRGGVRRLGGVRKRSDEP